MKVGDITGMGSKNRGNIIELVKIKERILLIQMITLLKSEIFSVGIFR